MGTGERTIRPLPPDTQHKPQSGDTLEESPTRLTPLHYDCRRHSYTPRVRSASCFNGLNAPLTHHQHRAARGRRTPPIARTAMDDSSTPLQDAALSIGARINDDIRAAITRLVATQVDDGDS
jgi:hypothetical protein